MIEDDIVLIVAALVLATFFGTLAVLVAILS